MIWPTKKLGEVCEVIGGGTPKTGVSRYWSGDIVWITPKDLGKLKGNDIYDSCKKISSEGLKESSARLLPKGTVVLSSRAPIGYVSIAGVPLATNQGCRSFICDDRKIYNKFLYYYLVTKREYLDQLGGGSTFREVSGSKLKEVEIPLPPLAEQKKIVAKLEKMLAKIKEARRLCAEACAAAQSLLSAELHKIFEEGKKKGWEENDLGALCIVHSGGTPKKGIPEYWRSGNIPWLRSEACRDNEVSEARLFITKAGLENSSARLFQSRTTLIALVGATIGKTGFLMFESATNQNIAGLYPKNERVLLPEFLFIATRNLYPYFLSIGKGKFKMANLTFVKSLKIYLPPLTEQKKIVARLDKLSAKLKKLEEHQKSTALDLARLEQSILQKAFSGDNFQ